MIVSDPLAKAAATGVKADDSAGCVSLVEGIPCVSPVEGTPRIWIAGIVVHVAGIADDVDLAILDLCCAGLWTCTDDGYVIRDTEVRRIARIVHDQVSDR